MKTDDLIIKSLLANPAQAVSGEKIAQSVGVSRAAIWKHIKGLRDLGFDIKGGSKRGYILEGIEDIIKPELIQKKLKTRFVGKKIIHKTITASTNADAFKLASEGAPEGTCVIADVQTAGRGRLGRTWVAPANGGILTSVVFRPNVPPQTATLLTLAAGIAAARTVRNVVDLKPWIKWPNDLFIGKRKLAGILTEMSAELDVAHFVVVGIGINVNIERKQMPPEIRKIATSLKAETGREISRNQLLATLYHELETAYYRLIQRGVSAITEEWEELADIRGKQVRASVIGDKKISGAAIGLDQDGALLIEDRLGKIRKITTGDVELT